MALAAAIPIRTAVETFPMTAAPTVLARLTRSEIQGAAVLLGFDDL